MQIERALINDRVSVSTESWKFCIPTSYSFDVIYSWNLLFFQEVAYFLTVSIVFSVYINKTLGLNNLKTRKVMNAKISVCYLC